MTAGFIHSNTRVGSKRKPVLIMGWSNSVAREMAAAFSKSLSCQDKRWIWGHSLPIPLVWSMLVFQASESRATMQIKLANCFILKQPVCFHCRYLFELCDHNHKTCIKSVFKTLQIFPYSIHEYHICAMGWWGENSKKHLLPPPPFLVSSWCIKEYIF